MQRTKLSHRTLPRYTRGEEIMNMVTHIVGGGLGILAVLLCPIRAHDLWGMITSIIYGFSMICLYAVSSIYHGLTPCTGKKVLQVLDHCTIYFLIAGTYTPIALTALRPANPWLGWGIFFLQWTMTALAVTLTAIDLKKYNVFSMICYITLGWAILPFAEQTRAAITDNGFLLLLTGGILYTVGAVLYGIGSKIKWFHSIFHIFVVFGSLFQFFAIYFFVL